MAEILAGDVANLIMSLPQELRELPLKYRDCDCGCGTHWIISVCPRRDDKGDIYLSCETMNRSVSDIVERYKSLVNENNEMKKAMDKAREDGVLTILHEKSKKPNGWDYCKVKTSCYRVKPDFDIHRANDRAEIINLFKDAICTMYISHLSNGEYVDYAEVGYPGSRRRLPFKMSSLDIGMSVEETTLEKGEYPIDTYLHLKFHFKVQISWTPMLDKWVDAADFKYDKLDVYEFDDNITLTANVNPMNAKKQ